MSEEIAGKKMNTQYRDENRIGDHIWWIGNLGKFESHYPEWKITYDVPRILKEVFQASVDRV